MNNLARHPEADHFIRGELVQAGVDIADHGAPVDRSEVGRLATDEGAAE